MLGQAVGLKEEELKKLSYSAYLHDIGKIEISRDILNKRGPLTDDEWQILASHPIWGADIIRSIEALKDSIPAVQHHHERFNGTGYPDRLKGYDIPLYARILTIADSFDAMVTNRPYKEGMSTDEAIEELKKWSGVQFDPDLVEKFINSLESNNKALFN
jgi:HD-GYP domain-containing protein (c-di-GMP phosphodiesterase class II)